MSIKGIRDVYHWDGSRFEKIKEAHEWSGSQWEQLYSSGTPLAESGTLDRVTVPRNRWISFATWVAPYSMTVTVSFVGFAWENPSKWERTAIMHNGVMVGDEENGAASLSRTFDVIACDEVTFEGECSSGNESARIVASGDWSATGTIPDGATACDTTTD